MAEGGGQTAKDPSAWTPDMLLALMEQRFADLAHLMVERDLRYEQRFEAQQHALAEKKETTDARLDLLNESRQTIDDLVSRTMPRAETDARMAQVDARITENAARLAADIIRLTADIATINSILAASAGKGAGLEKGWGYLLGAVGLMVAVVAVVIAVVIR